MTKDDFYTALINNGNIDLKDKAIVDEFFDSNVVIPKGQSPHPYADVLHELVEGTIVEARAIGNSTNNWSEAKLFNFDFEYRIKPSEPIYEYQCLYRRADQGYSITEPMTLEEMDIHRTTHGQTWVLEPIEQSKKERT